MKAVEIKLTEKELETIKPITEQLNDAEHLIDMTSKRHRRLHNTLWDKLRGLYPQCSLDATDQANFNFESGIIKFFEEDTEVMKFKRLKESAIKAGDFDLAAEYRNKEREAKKNAKI